MTSTDAGHVSRLLLQAVAHHAYPVSPIDDLGGWSIAQGREFVMGVV